MVPQYLYRHTANADAVVLRNAALPFFSEDNQGPSVLRTARQVWVVPPLAND